jgi:uncharacterized protein (DUF1697 family)
MRYVALLRGINVGGNNKIEMRELKAAFEDAGMADVSTYINSGNVVFSTGEQRSGLAEHLERAIEERFGFPVRVVLRDVDEMRTLVSALPAEWANDATQKCDVVFLAPEADSDALIASLEPRPEIESLVTVPGAIVWRVARKDATRSRLIRMMGTPFYRQVTVRNCNTARKLLQLLER